MGIRAKQAVRSGLEPIPSVEMAHYAAGQIREAIIDGRYKPGTRLIERELSEQLNVSRHPVREALRLLSREGFVDLHRNRGAQVSSIEPSLVTQVYGIRMALGSLALDELIGPRKLITAVDLKQLEKLLNSALRFAKAEKHDEAVEADLEFQQLIVDLSRLERVRKYFVELTDDVRRFDRTLRIVYTDQENYLQKYNVQLLSAVKAGDLDQARAIWRGKFDKAVERFLSALTGAELDGAKLVIPKPR